VSEIALLDTTGDRQVDAILRGLVGILETVFPGRIRGYHLFGSYADGSNVPTSDIDRCLVPATPLTAADEDRLQRIGRARALLGGRGVDLIAIGEEALLREGHFRIEAGSRLIYGVDVRDRMPRQSSERYLGRYVHAPCDYITQVLRARDFQPAGYLACPLEYPDPAGEFYGYDRPRLAHGTEPVPNIQALVATACWIATVIVGLRAGRTVAAKGASVRLYRELIGDDRAPWLEALYEWGNRRWGYRIPAAPAERRRLHNLCAPMLAFENHYLALYRDYLLARLRREDGEDAERVAAARRLGEVIYSDDETLGALRAIADDGNRELRRDAARALQRIEDALSLAAGPCDNLR
jgi:predicted nucleotidyltransferase